MKTNLATETQSHRENEFKKLFSESPCLWGNELLYKEQICQQKTTDEMISIS
jgi:hypothetical protein